MRISVRTLVLVLGLQLLLGAVLVVLAVQGFPFLKGATEEDPPARGSAFDGARARGEPFRRRARAGRRGSAGRARPPPGGIGRLTPARRSPAPAASRGS